MTPAEVLLWIEVAAKIIQMVEAWKKKSAAEKVELVIKSLPKEARPVLSDFTPEQLRQLIEYFLVSGTPMEEKP